MSKKLKINTIRFLLSLSFIVIFTIIKLNKTSDFEYKNHQKSDKILIQTPSPEKCKITNFWKFATIPDTKLYDKYLILSPTAQNNLKQILDEYGMYFTGIEDNKLILANSVSEINEFKSTLTTTIDFIDYLDTTEYAFESSKYCKLGKTKMDCRGYTYTILAFLDYFIEKYDIKENLNVEVRVKSTNTEGVLHVYPVVNYNNYSYICDYTSSSEDLKELLNILRSDFEYEK